MKTGETFVYLAFSSTDILIRCQWSSTRWWRHVHRMQLHVQCNSDDRFDDHRLLCQDRTIRKTASRIEWVRRVFLRRVNRCRSRLNLHTDIFPRVWRVWWRSVHNHNHAGESWLNRHPLAIRENGQWHSFSVCVWHYWWTRKSTTSSVLHSSLRTYHANEPKDAKAKD